MMSLAAEALRTQGLLSCGWYKYGLCLGLIFVVFLYTVVERLDKNGCWSTPSGQ
jgi:hypothetical protein